MVTLERSNYVQCVNVNSQSTIHNLQSTMHNSQSTIHNLQFTVHNLQSTIHNPQSTIYNPQSTIYNTQSTSYNPQSAIHNLQSTSTVHSLPIESTTHDTNCTKCEQQLTIYNLQFTITASEVTQWWYMYECFWVSSVHWFQSFCTGAIIPRLCLLSLQRNAVHVSVLTCFQDSGTAVGCECLVG